MNTPTDDLRARHVGVLRSILAGDERDVTHPNVASALNEAIAALSALPAGGGPVSDGPFGAFYTCGRCHGTGVTTPPPDAAVGAQGDGDSQFGPVTDAELGEPDPIPRNATPTPAAGKGVDADMFMSAFNCEAENTTGTRLYDSERQNVINALEAALTRQPVAGDGSLVGELVEMGDDDSELRQPRLLIHTTRDAIRACKLVPFRYVRVTPTDTPADGGEG